MILDLLKSLRPQQWLKNVVVLAPAFFAGQILNSDDWVRLAWAFVLLSAASSGSYLINDIIDRDKDRLHPLKSHRPIASGKLPIEVAVLVAIALLTFSIQTALQFSLYF